MSTAAALPRWDMSVVFPSLESPEFADGFASAVRAIDGLGELFDAEGIADREPAPLDDATTQAFERVVERYNAVLDEYRTLSVYIAAFVSTDSRDDVAQARQSELRQQSLKLAQLGTRFTAWIGSLDVDALLAVSDMARAHEWMLRKAAMQARHLMAPEEEALAQELNLSGGSAWSRLHSDVTSQLAVPVALGGESRELTMSEVRNLAYDTDREVRRRGYEAELAGWERAAVPLAAGGGAAGSGAEQHQGLGQRRLAPARLGVAAGRSDLRREHRPADAGRDDDGGSRVVPRLPALPAGEGAGARH